MTRRVINPESEPEPGATEPSAVEGRRRRREQRHCRQPRDSVPERLVHRATGRSLRDNRPLIAVIFSALEQCRNGASLEDAARDLGLSADELAHWREKYRGVTIQTISRLERLERENRRLKRKVHALRLDQYMVQSLLNDRS